MGKGLNTGESADPSIFQYEGLAVDSLENSLLHQQTSSLPQVSANFRPSLSILKSDTILTKSNVAIEAQNPLTKLNLHHKIPLLI